MFLTENNTVYKPRKEIVWEMKEAKHGSKRMGLADAEKRHAGSRSRGLRVF